MAKAVILARVSTLKQEKEGLSLKDIQLPALRDYAQNKGLAVEREFDEMVEYVKANNDIKTVIAYRVDRITRNFRDAVLIDELRLNHDKEIHFVYDRLVNY